MSSALASDAESKQTQLQLAPWSVVSLGELGSFLKGAGVRKDESQSGDIPCVRYGELYTDHDDILREFRSFISRDVAATATRIKAGDILFAGSGETKEEIGKCVAFVKTIEAYAGGDIVILRTSGNDPTFLGYALNQRDVQRQKASKGQGDAVVHISARALSSISVAIPPLIEQQAIAEALLDADALIAGLENFVGKKRAIKKGAMQELLSGRRRLPGFSDEWTSKQIGEFTDVTAGGTPSTLIPEYWGGNVRWMSSGELHLKQIYDVEGRITDKGLAYSAAKMLPENCVLIGLAGQGKTRGTAAINRVPLCTNQSIGAILPSSSFSSDFLFHNIDSRYDELRELSSGDGGRGGLNLAIIKSLSVAFPSLVEQQAIAEVLNCLDDDIAALTERLVKAREIKQGMMRELFTGRARLV